jgi:hypothetical protein
MVVKPLKDCRQTKTRRRIKTIEFYSIMGPKIG